jgi:hypothetical protein
MELVDISLTMKARVFCSMLFTVPSTGGFYISLTKDSSLLLHAIHNPYYGADFIENYTLLWF